MKRENQGIYLMMLQVCKEHIKKVLIIISLLIASVVIAYIQPLLLSKLTDRGILGQNVSNLLFYSLIMFIISQLRGVFDFMIKKIAYSASSVRVFRQHRCKRSALNGAEIRYYRCKIL